MLFAILVFLLIAAPYGAVEACDAAIIAPAAEAQAEPIEDATDYY